MQRPSSICRKSQVGDQIVPGTVRLSAEEWPGERESRDPRSRMKPSIVPYKAPFAACQRLLELCIGFILQCRRNESWPEILWVILNS